jgi:hypothetical protein
MNILKSWIQGNENKWLWYGGTLIGSMVPLIFRLLISLDNRHVACFDIKDLLFMGLAINLSNFNLIGTRNFPYKVAIAIVSGIFILLMGFALGTVMTDESNSTPNPFLWLKIISSCFVLFSVYMSYEANRFLFENVNQ